MILVDVGNSAIKWCAYVTQQKPHLGVVQRCGRAPKDLLNALSHAGVEPCDVVVASVAGTDFDAELEAVLLSAGFSQVKFLVSAERFGDLHNSYAEPVRMGVDRWLAMLAARQNCLEPLAVIDAGSAITIDLIARDGRHQGGYILPGVSMMERALLRDTQRVRFDARAAATVAPGKTTASCVSAGVWVAALGAVKLVLASHLDHRVVVTGGDGQALLGLGVNGEWRPDLVLEGMAITLGT